MDFPPPIKRLPSDAVAHIRSSLSIRNLIEVVLELVKNSLDATPQTISVVVDFAKGGCTVEDDGYGIRQQEFETGGGIAVRYNTSKFHDGSRVFYGEKGEFLSCLISLALVIITSRHSSDSHPNTLIFHNSKTINRLIPAPPQHELLNPEHGTKVTVTDLFGSMPVRVKQRALRLQKPDCIDRDWDDLKHELTALLIAFQRPVTVLLSDVSRSRKLTIRGKSKVLQREPLLRSVVPTEIQSDYVRSILSQAGYMPASSMDSWVTISAQGDNISVGALVSLEASPTKQVQFISLGMRPLHASPGAEGSMLFDTINQIFAASRFGSTQHDFKYESGASEPRKRGTTNKSVNRWPMFCCRIEMQNEHASLSDETAFGVSRPSRSLQTLLDIISALFRQFLQQYYFLPGLHMDNKNQSPRLFSARDTEAAPRQSKHPEAMTPTISLPSRPGTSASTTEENAKRVEKTSSGANYKPPTDFSSWNRIKASKHAEIDSLSSAIYQSTRNPTSTAKVSGRPSMKRRVLSDTFIPKASPEQSQRIINGSEAQTPIRSEDGPCLKELPDETVFYVDAKTQESVLLNSRTGQSILSRPNTAPAQHTACRCHEAPDAEDPTPTDWIDGMIKKWHNPVFSHPESSVHSVVPGVEVHADDRSSFFGRNQQSGSIPDDAHAELLPTSSTPGGPFTPGGPLTKENLRSAELISQVDNKYLLVKVRVRCASSSEPQTILVLIDQHAADERCRIEKLFADLVSRRYGTLKQGASETETHEGLTTLPEPIQFTVSQDEARLFERYSTYFASWGCHYEVAVNSTQRPVIYVTRLPALISERWVKSGPAMIKEKVLRFINLLMAGGRLWLAYLSLVPYATGLKRYLTVPKESSNF
ncbi:hypothetical protein KEM56_002738 [Ascosphaera pollenicola]|nr:hypothetical protein KEM56_002738 [Ascosphaera pollenicola]